MLPERIRAYLENRGLSQASIEKYKIGWNGSAIIIPVGQFNKYRKDPDNDSTDVPKYWYEKGHKATLFNSEVLDSAYSVIICEGEFDCILLNQYGFPAVTSTGGAGTFLDEWTELFLNKTVYICMDNDKAGRTAAVNLLFMFPKAKLIVLPRGHKDVTEFYMAGEMKTFKYLLSDATDWPELCLSDNMEEMRARILALRQKKNVSWTLLKEISAVAMPILEEMKDRIFRMHHKPKAHKDNTDQIKVAKETPLQNIYQGKLTKFGNKLRGLCPFHNETTPSFFIYTDNNSWYCYGCSIGGDSIDFVMKRDDCDFNVALSKLL